MSPQQAAIRASTEVRLATPSRAATNAPKMPREKEGDDQRAEADERPFEDDVRALGKKLEQEGEADNEIKKPP